MGSGRFSSSDWAAYASTSGISNASSADSIFKTSRNDVKEDYLPINIKVRESCDSVDNPNSTPIAIFLDVTGSMGSVLTSCAKSIGTLFEEIYSRKPVTDPHIMYGGIGDVECDDYPIQVTQFEADLRIVEQMKDIYFERGGGGNDYESYTAAWYFCAAHTSIDSLIKRGKKGILFTIGDEEPTRILRKEDIKEFFGDDVQKDYTAKELYDMVSKKYDVYHLIIEEGSHCRAYPTEVIGKWTDLLGQNAIKVSDHTKISEIIVSILEIRAGKDKDSVIKSWGDNSTALAVSDAVNDITIKNNETSDVMIFD